MSDPHGHRFWLRAEGSLGFERGPAERKPFTPPTNGVGNGCVEQSEVKRNSFGGRFPLETNVVSDCCSPIP
jgi:hypothetical protein